jgi:hypothetical protein
MVWEWHVGPIQMENPALKNLLDPLIKLWSLLFLQRAKTLIANKNEEVVGVALRLSPTADAKGFMPLHLLLLRRGNASNRVGKHARQFAFEERGDAKLHSLSPQMHDARRPLVGSAAPPSPPTPAVLRLWRRVGGCIACLPLAVGDTVLRWKGRVLCRRGKSQFAYQFCNVLLDSALECYQAVWCTPLCITFAHSFWMNFFR